MWRLYQTCKTLSQLPSDRLGVTNDWAAYQIDDAVVWFGVTVENALAERVNHGSAEKPDWRDKYTLEQLLEPDFRLPRPGQPLTGKQAAAQALSSYIDTLIGSAGKLGSGGRVFQYKPPVGGH